MSRIATINVRMEAELKKQAEELFEDLGMNMSTAITIFLKQAVRVKGLPFSVRKVDDPFFDKENAEELRRSIAQFDRGEAKVRKLIDIDG